MSFTAKVQLTDVREYGEGAARSVALAFSPDYRDGRNSDWAHNTPGLSLSMTVRGDVADRLSLAPGQAFTLTFDRDGDEQGIVAPAAQTETEPEDTEVIDAETGEPRRVTRSEAVRLGYDTAGGAPQGLAAPVGVAPQVLELPEQDGDAPAAEAPKKTTGKR